MIQQQILAIPPAVQIEVERINQQVESATPDQLLVLIAKRDAILAQREPRPIAIGEQF